MDLFIFVCIPAFLHACCVHHLIASYEAYYAGSSEWNIMFHRAAALFMTSAVYLWMTIEYLHVGGA